MRSRAIATALAMHVLGALVLVALTGLLPLELDGRHLWVMFLGPVASPAFALEAGSSVISGIPAGTIAVGAAIIASVVASLGVGLWALMRFHPTVKSWLAVVGILAWALLNNYLCIGFVNFGSM